MNFAAIFDQGLRYEAFLSKYGSDEHRRRWEAVYSQAQLSTNQNRLLAGFTREMKVLVVAGTWCGDCVNQCPIFQHFSAQSDKIRDQPCLRTSLVGTKGCSAGPWSLNLSMISSIPRLRSYHHKVPATNIHVTARAGNFQPRAHVTPGAGRSNRSR